MNFRRTILPAPGPLVLAPALLAFLAAGCEQGTSITEKIFIRSEAYFYGKPGEEVGPLTVQVLGPAIHGVPGRSGFRDPVVGKTVQFILLDVPAKTPADQAPSLVPYEGAENASDGEGPPQVSRGDATLDVDSDSKGFARVKVRLPVWIGDWRVRALIRNEQTEERTVAFGVVSGIKVQTSEEENFVGRKVQASIVVYRVADGEVVPDADRQVQFRIADEPYEGTSRLGSDRLADRIRTTDQGVAVTNITLGDRSGPYVILAQPQPRSAKPGAEPDRSPILSLPAVVLRGIAIDWTKAAGEFLAGVLLFIVGLRFLSSGLIIILGPSLALPVTRLQKSPFRAFLGGLAAGAMFQSSASVGSRLISFANGGLLTAAGAVTMLLGANIGRTLLPQVLAFPIGQASAVLIGLGTLGLFLPRRLGINAWGWVMLGAGLAVLGFVAMEWGVDNLQFSKTFQSTLKEWDYTSPSFSLGSKLWVFTEVALAAAAAGFIFRSSNLPVVLAIALGNGSLLEAPVTLPIVLGANLGPALALLGASLGRRREARRIALVQLLFQAVGVVFLGLFSLIAVRGTPLLLYVADWLTPGLLFHPIPEHVGHHIAMVHTVYNVFTTAVCLFLARPLLGLAERVIPRDPVEDDIKPYNLDPNLVEVPALAILQATREATYLVELCRKAVAESFDAFRYRDLKLADQTVRREESVAGVHRDLSQYLLRVGENDLSRREASRLEVLQAAAGNLVRIAAQSERLRDITLRELEEDGEMPEDVGRDLNEIYDLVMAQFDNVLQLLEGPDGRTEENAVKLAERLAKFGSRVEHAWMEKLRTRGPAPELDGVESSVPALDREKAAVRREDAAGGAPMTDPGGATLLPEPPAARRGGDSPGDGTAPLGSRAWASRGFARILIYRDALETLFQVAGHLSHITERMRVLSPKR